MAVAPSTAAADAQPRRRGEVTRQRILDAAETLFAERGYEGTTLRDVAERVGLRTPSLYNHFDSKEALYGAVLERGLGPVLRLLSGYVGQQPAPSTVGGEIIGLVLKILLRTPALPHLLQHETLSGGRRLTPMLREYLIPIITHGLDMAAAPARESGWDEDDVPLLVLALIQTMLAIYTMAPLYRDLNGVDLLGDASVEHQTRFLTEFSQRLFSPR